MARVVAPEDGLVGKTEVYAGTLVGRGLSTLLTRISQIDNIHVRFTIPERDYLRFALEENRVLPVRFPQTQLGIGLVTPWSFFDRLLRPSC